MRRGRRPGGVWKTSGVAVARELVLVQRHAQARAGRQIDRARREVELGGDDIVGRLQRSDAFETVDDVSAGAREHDLRHGAYADAETVTDHAPDSRGLSGLGPAQGTAGGGPL